MTGLHVLSSGGVLVDRTTGVPAFRQVADDIRMKIQAGEYAPGAQLPSERVLVERYGVSRPTVRDALALLATQGLTRAEHGRGVFVRAAQPVQRLSRSRLSRAAREANRGAFLGDAAHSGFTPTSTVSVKFEAADSRVADLLGIEPGAEVTVRDRVMSADGVPVQLAVSRLPRALTRGTAIEREDTGTGGTYSRLEEAGHGLVRFTEVVRARMPSPEELSALRLAPGTPVLTVTRVAFADAPVEVTDMVLSGERYELGYEWPAD